jgi:hypothetical protein
MSTPPEKTTATTTEEKSAVVAQTDKLPPPAVAPPPTLERPGLLPRKWEVLLIMHFALTKATMPTLHFWLYTAARTLLVAVAIAILKERPEGMMPIVQAAVNVIRVRPSRAKDNFWVILLSRIGASVEA